MAPLYPFSDRAEAWLRARRRAHSRLHASHGDTARRFWAWWAHYCHGQYVRHKLASNGRATPAS